MGKFCLAYSYVALLIIPLVILLYFEIRKNFINFSDRSEQQSYESGKKQQRLIFFAMRSLIFIFLLIAIASPFILEEKTVKGNPRITILVDNDMEKELVGKLRGSIPVTVRTLAAGDKSAIGDGILNNMERDENVLVISDGSNNDGKLLGDIMLL